MQGVCLGSLHLPTRLQQLFGHRFALAASRTNCVGLVQQLQQQPDSQLLWYCAASLDCNGWHNAAPAVARKTRAPCALPHGVQCGPACSTQHDVLAGPRTNDAAASARRVHRRHARACGDRRLLAHYSFVAAVLQQHSPAVHVAHSRRGKERSAAVAAGNMTTMCNQNNITPR